jgi:hypothetical protein
MRNFPILLALLFLLLSIIEGKYIYQNFEDPIFPTGIFVLFSCLLSLTAISIGWWISLYIARRQSTLTIISQSRLNEYYLSRMQVFTRVFPSGKVMTLEQADDPKNQDALESLFVILNFLEFVGLGIREGDLSESVCKAYFRQIFTNQWLRSSEFIHRYQIQVSENGFINFEHYAKKWNPTLIK